MRTVAGELEAALLRLLGEPIKVTAAGRTDAGVHASGQVISFRTTRPFRFDRLAVALNAALPPDLAVREATVVPAGFSARFSALDRRYVYAIAHRPQRSAFLRRYAAHVWVPLDLEAFASGAAHLIGEHDFRSFCGVLPPGGRTVRRIRDLRIERVGDLLRIEIAADGFLHRMVRTIVGTLLECAIGRRDSDSIPKILAATDRAAAGKTAPAQGLYLAGVRYPDGYDSFAPPPLFTGTLPLDAGGASR
ncbi:MAG: tRNA pseudouridine(38-40) synthase TruA [Vulcanimicrobiaceae bacterium]